MSVKELIEKLQNIPSNAVVYIESDYGQTPEKQGRILFSDREPVGYYGEDMNWRESPVGAIKAVLIC